MIRLSRSQCHHVARVLQSYLDGEADPPTSEAVAAHLEVCRRCGLEATTYQEIKAAITVTAPGAARPVDDDAVERLKRFADTLSARPD